MKFDIPKKCEIRWQAALAVLEDLQEDKATPFDMSMYADTETQWEKENGCGTPACFAGYISVAPYCQLLGYPSDNFHDGYRASGWLMSSDEEVVTELHVQLFSFQINKGSRSKTLAYLKKTLKSIFKESTGKNLIAPLTFYVD